MRRRRPESDGDPLDSLLDTLTNVVGILVIVLVVLQMGVKEAVQRAVTENPVDPAALARAQAEAADLEAEAARLQQQLRDLRPTDPRELEERLGELRRQIAADQQAALTAQAQQQADEAARAQARQQAAAAEAELAEQKAAREKLEQELATALSEAARLQAVLDQTPLREQAPAKIVQLPFPRPAPEGAKPIHCICWENRVYPLDLEGLQQAAQRRAAFVVQQKRLDRDPAKGIDPAAFVAEFNKTPVRDDYFEVAMKAAGPTPRLVFTPRPRAGEEDPALTNPRSNFRRRLASVSASQHYFRFFVQPDSFDIYVTARRVISDLKLPAGWEPQGAEWKFEANLGGALRLGPPPPPPPPAPPDPPPAPQPPPKPPPPPNVID